MIKNADERQDQLERLAFSRAASSRRPAQDAGRSTGSILSRLGPRPDRTGPRPHRSRSPPAGRASGRGRAATPPRRRRSPPSPPRRRRSPLSPPRRDGRGELGGTGRNPTHPGQGPFSRPPSPTTKGGYSSEIARWSGWADIWALTQVSNTIHPLRSGLDLTRFYFQARRSNPHYVIYRAPSCWRRQSWPARVEWSQPEGLGAGHQGSRPETPWKGCRGARRHQRPACSSTYVLRRTCYVVRSSTCVSVSFLARIQKTRKNLLFVTI